MRHIRSIRVNVRSLAAILVVAGLLLGAPAGAIAQSVNPTDEQYNHGVIGTSVSGGPSSGSSVGTLPFTGLDVAAIAAIGIGLLGSGYVVRRAARSGNGTSS